jgi:sodium-dependent dicarboxylate transporter 2/3/5
MDRRHDMVMRTHSGAVDAVETYSPAEEQFNTRRRTVGLFLGPLVLVALLVAPLPLPAPAHRLAGILAMMVIFWVTEALPLAVTAMLGPVLAVILRVAPVRAAFASFADPVIFVFTAASRLPRCRGASSVRARAGS